jgi:hypothetical protein
LRKIFFLHRDHSSSQQNKTAAMEYNNDAFAGFAPNASKRACAASCYAFLAAWEEILSFIV